MRRGAGGALLLLALLIVGCGGDATTSTSTTTTTRQTIYGTLTGPTTGRTLTAADPLRVTLFGDSLIYDAEPAVTANLASTGVVSTSARATPGFNFGRSLSVLATEDFDWRSLIRDMMTETNPEVVITTFGIIDSAGIANAKQTPEALAAALREALTLMTAGTTKVIMFGVLPSLDDAGKPTVRPMNRDANPIMQQIATEFAGEVEYYDTDLLLSDTGAPVYSFEGRRVRKLDLIHICPDGAALIATAVHDTLARSWPVPAPAADWASGAWRGAARYDDPPGACVSTHPGVGS